MISAQELTILLLRQDGSTAIDFVGNRMDLHALLNEYGSWPDFFLELLATANIKHALYQRRYAKTFVRERLNELCRLAEMNREDFRDLGILRGDGIALVKAAQAMLNDPVSEFQSSSSSVAEDEEQPNRKKRRLL